MWSSQARRSRCMAAGASSPTSARHCAVGIGVRGPGRSGPDLGDALLGLLEREPAMGAPMPVTTGWRTAMSPAVGRLVRTDLKLMTRDPLVLTFAFAVPVVTLLVIGGAFSTTPEPGPAGANPSVPASGYPRRRARSSSRSTTRSKDSSTSNVTAGTFRMACSPRPAAHPRADRHLSQRPGGQPLMRSMRWS
jgi:hypothetical protein